VGERVLLGHWGLSLRLSSSLPQLSTAYNEYTEFFSAFFRHGQQTPTQMSLTLYKTTRTANLVGPDIRTVTASQQHGQGRAYACSTHGSNPPPVATKPAPPVS
jgi:hypothetical protein